MSDKMNFAWCILHTANITAEKIKAAQDTTFGEITDEDLENWMKAYKEVDGVKAMIATDSGYTLIGWEDDADEKMMMFYYYAEQDSMMGCYQDDFERFKREWQNKVYEPDGCIVFDPENVEIIETIDPEKGEGHEKLSQ